MWFILMVTLQREYFSPNRLTTCPRLLGKKTRGNPSLCFQVNIISTIVPQLFITYRSRIEFPRLRLPRSVPETPPTSPAEDTYSHASQGSGSGCLCALTWWERSSRIHERRSSRENIARKENYHFMLREGKSTTLKAQRSCNHCQTQAQPSQREPTSAQVAIGNIMQSSFPVLGMYVACSQTSQPEVSEQAPQWGRMTFPSPTTPCFSSRMGWRQLWRYSPGVELLSMEVEGRGWRVTGRWWTWMANRWCENGRQWMWLWKLEGILLRQTILWRRWATAADTESLHRQALRALPGSLPHYSPLITYR